MQLISLSASTVSFSVSSPFIVSPTVGALDLSSGAVAYRPLLRHISWQVSSPDPVSLESLLSSSSTIFVCLDDPGTAE